MTRPPGAASNRLSEASFGLGLDALAARDGGLRRIVEQYGPPPLWVRDPGFVTLLQIILEQQVSLASARATFDRLCVAAHPLAPSSLLALDDQQLRTIGFSRQKARYVRSLAALIAEGELDLEALALLDDDVARAGLLRVSGIGPWSADIYLLVALRRPDIWPAGDLALAKSIQTLRGLDAVPGTSEMGLIAESWRPWRAVAARKLWHSYLSKRAAAGHPT